MISSKLQAFDFSHPYTQSSKKAQISNEQTFEGIMTGYKTDIETVSWTLDDPLFSFDSGQPKNDVSSLHKIINVSTTAIYTWKTSSSSSSSKELWDERSTCEDGRLPHPNHHHDCQYTDTSKCLNVLRLTNPKTISSFLTTHTFRVMMLTQVSCVFFTHSPQNDTFVPGSLVWLQMKWIHRRQINLKHVRPQFCRFYRNSLILTICRMTLSWKSSIFVKNI